MSKIIFKPDPAPLPTVSFQDPIVVVDEGSTAPLTIIRGDDGVAGNVNVGELQQHGLLLFPHV